MDVTDFIALLVSRNITFTREAGGIAIDAGNSHVYLSSLTALPSDVQFNNHSHVYLGSLTALPSDVQFNNHSHVYLGSLTNEDQTYRGKQIKLRIIDGYTMLIGASHIKGDVTITRTQYFGGEKMAPKRCYIASQGEHNAHGETMQESMLDLRFKIAQVDFESTELVKAIKDRGAIRWHEFRLLTGACAEGLREGLRELGFAPDLEEMPLADALKMVRGRYGDSQMLELFGEAA
jgi:hypothetical protein